MKRDIENENLIKNVSEYAVSKIPTVAAEKNMLTNAARSASLRGDIISTISEMDYEELSSLFQYVRCSSIRSEWTGIDLSATFPEDALYSIASFLDSKTLSAWQSCSSSMLRSFDIPWYKRGLDRFRNVLVNGEGFANSESVISSWYTRYIEFSSHIKISPKDRVLANIPGEPKAVCTSIPLYQKVSCTVPAEFSVLLSGTTYITMTMSLRFSPEAVRSVVGLIQAPLFPLPESSLECDRGLSRKYWGLAFGPLTGVVSTQGRYFDDFPTYRARHGLKDYLSTALKETVTVQVGILIHEGKIAFYRLPESDYPDWECTGFVYDCFDNSTKSYFNFIDTPCVYPSVMFTHIGHRDHISVSIHSITDRPVYWPHENERAKDFSNWGSFTADRVDGDELEPRIPSPPPSSPMSMDMDDYPDEVILVSQRDA